MILVVRIQYQVSFVFRQVPGHLICFLELSLAFKDLYKLYINDPGDHDLVDDEEGAAGLQSMADYLHGIVD